jgi:hypothetical protein
MSSGLLLRVIWKKYAKVSEAYNPDGRSKHLWNVGKLLSDYAVKQTRREKFHIRESENLKSHQASHFGQVSVGVTLYTCSLETPGTNLETSTWYSDSVSWSFSVCLGQ